MNALRSAKAGACDEFRSKQAKVGSLVQAPTSVQDPMQLVSDEQPAAQGTMHLVSAEQPVVQDPTQSGSVKVPAKKSATGKSIRERIAVKLKAKRTLKFTHKSNETKCGVCGATYLKQRDHMRSGRWVGGEKEEECGTWVHLKCIGWTEVDVNYTRDYYCSACKKE